MEDIFDEKEGKLDLWNVLKLKLHKGHVAPHISEGEVWWVSCGENIGVEINGKSKSYTRPVLVYHKFNRESFLGIPFTTQKHTGSWYVPFKFQGRQNYAVLNQIRCFDARRLHRRMGRLDELDMVSVAEGFVKLYSKKYPPQLETRESREILENVISF